MDTAGFPAAPASLFAGMAVAVRRTGAASAVAAIFGTASCAAAAATTVGLPGDASANAAGAADGNVATVEAAEV